MECDEICCCTSSCKRTNASIGKTFLGENYCVRGGGVIEIAGYIGIFAALAFKDITEAQDSIGLVRCGIVQTIGFLAGRILNTAVNIIKN